MTVSSDSGTASLEDEPAVAQEIFGQKIDLVRRFVENLDREGEIRGLIGPLERQRLWNRHILNCGVLASLIRPGIIGDVGTGAGLPGIVLALTRPDASFVLIEPMERRVAWLTEQVADLGLDNVRVIRARSQDLRPRLHLDQVTARAVSSLKKLLPLTTPLLRDGGELLLMKGSSVHDEIVAAQRELAFHRVHDVEVIVLGEGKLTEVTRVLRAKVR